MLFTTIQFIIFLTITITLYFIFPLNKRWIILLIASGIFYCMAGLKFIPFVLITSFATYYSALLIDRRHGKLNDMTAGGELDEEQEKEAKEKCGKICKRILVITLLIVLGLLSYTKFTHIIIDLLQRAMTSLGVRTVQLSEISVIIPLGISYYTFSTVGYILDVYWKKYRAERNFFKYLLFVLYFPHILQGPFARYNRLAHQLTEGHRFSYERACFGIQLMLWGYFKKLVVADRLAVFVNSVYGDWENQAGFVIVIATFFAAIQIYTDFSGCVDMARGMSQILGIELDKNFRQPYFSRSVEEYWRRWHISLGIWFKDYLYMPVFASKFVANLIKKAKGKYGNKAGRNVAAVVPLIVVWIATGVWHGTGWGHVIWGIWNGGIIISSTLLKNRYVDLRKRLCIKEKKREWQLFQVMRTFILAAFIPKVFTLTDSVSSAWGMIRNMFSEFNVWVFFDQSLYTYGLDRQDFWLAMISIFIVFCVSLMKEKGIQIRESIARKNIVFRWAVYYAAIFSIIIFGMYGPGYDASNFVYMQF